MMNKTSRNGSGGHIHLLFAIEMKNFCLYFSGFIEDNPDGLLSRDKMLKMYIDVLSNDKAKRFVEQIFSKYDTDNSGAIDFRVSVVLHDVKIVTDCLLAGVHDGDTDDRL